MWVPLRVSTAIVALGCGRSHFDLVVDGVDAPVLAECALPSVRTSALVGWWTFDEPSGDTAFDHVGANDGSLVGGVGRAPGHLGGALAFDGVSGHVDVAGSVEYATSSAPFSLSVWANLTAYTAESPDLMQLKTDSGTSPFHLLLSNHPGFIGISTGAGGGSWIPTRTGVQPTLGSWHHVVMVYNGSGSQSLGSFTIYLDNTVQPLEAASPYETQANTSRLGAAERAENYWSGRIDDVRIYSEALSPDDVAALFALACQ